MTERDNSSRSVDADRLAEERTKLARERTILAHIRTGFASFLFGTALIGFIENVVTDVVGGFFILVGVVFLVTGWLSYVRSNRRTRQITDRIENPFGK